MNWEKQMASSGGSLMLDWDHLSARFRQVQRSSVESNGQPTEDVPEPQKQESAA
jgi:hypothetical protein